MFSIHKKNKFSYWEKTFQCTYSENSQEIHWICLGKAFLSWNDMLHRDYGRGVHNHNCNFFSDIFMLVYTVQIFEIWSRNCERMVMRVVWTLDSGQVNSWKKKFEGCAFMQQQAIYAIPINKPMNCRNQGITNYVGHGKKQKNSQK